MTYPAMPGQMAVSPEHAPIPDRPQGRSGSSVTAQAATPEVTHALTASPNDVPSPRARGWASGVGGRVMRTITDHIVNPCNEKLRITVADEPGAGGASHRYEVTGFDAGTNESGKAGDYADRALILFQNGPIPEKGTNGITQEVLLAIVADRLRCFQAGPYACRENALALTKIEEAQHWLQQRTLARMRRGVEGTHQV